ncbi:hypothetical protein AB8O53_27075 [Streptomyces pilosus]
MSASSVRGALRGVEGADGSPPARSPPVPPLISAYTVPPAASATTRAITTSSAVERLSLRGSGGGA